MNNAIIWGYGRLGKCMSQCLQEMRVPCFIVDKDGEKPVSSQIIFDFSTPEGTMDMLDYAEKTNIPAVIGVTGHNQSQLERIRSCARNIPLFMESNFSFGVYSLKKILQYGMKYLKDWDCEIVECHHANKTDKPSGTAKSLCEIVNPEVVHSVRVGTVAGTHSVIFASQYETLTLTHSTQDIRVFCHGAIEAAQWLIGKPKGLYTLDDIFLN